jgi:hypothetical protein
VAKRATRKIVVQDVTKKWNPRATDQKTWETHSQTLNDFSKIINDVQSPESSTTQQACVRNLGLWWHSNKETKGSE